LHGQLLLVLLPSLLLFAGGSALCGCTLWLLWLLLRLLFRLLFWLLLWWLLWLRVTKASWLNLPLWPCCCSTSAGSTSTSSSTSSTSSSSGRTGCSCSSRNEAA
jgi:hypothetical protein